MEKTRLQGCSIIEKVSLLNCFAELPLKKGELLDCFGACKELKLLRFDCSYDPESRVNCLRVKFPLFIFNIWTSGKIIITHLRSLDAILLSDKELRKLWLSVLRKHKVKVE